MMYFHLYLPLKELEEEKKTCKKHLLYVESKLDQLPDNICSKYFLSVNLSVLPQWSLMKWLI